MFVFTTEVSHGAGFVCPGESRRIVRGHCYSHDLLRVIGLKF